MPMDGFTLSYMRRELLAALQGGRVDKVNQPERDALVLLIRSGGGNHRLLLSANANQARAQLTAQTYENPAEPPMFCMLMRKHLLGARVRDVGQVAGDRILTLVFECLDELGDSVEKTLYLEVMGRHSNLTLVRSDGVIIDAIRHVNSEMSRVRTVQPGGAYQLPPQQDKLDPEGLTPDSLAERLAAQGGALAKGLMACVAGMASVCAREICAQVGADPAVPVSDLDLSALSPRLVQALRDIPAAPVALYDEAGLAVDFFPFPYRTFAAERQKAMPSLSAAMDAFYLGRDLRARMQQKSAGLQRAGTHGKEKGHYARFHPTKRSGGARPRLRRPADSQPAQNRPGRIQRYGAELLRGRQPGGGYSPLHPAYPLTERAKLL